MQRPTLLTTGPKLSEHAQRLLEGYGITERPTGRESVGFVNAAIETLDKARIAPDHRTVSFALRLSEWKRDRTLAKFADELFRVGLSARQEYEASSRKEAPHPLAVANTLLSFKRQGLLAHMDSKAIVEAMHAALQGPQKASRDLPTRQLVEYAQVIHRILTLDKVLLRLGNALLEYEQPMPPHEEYIRDLDASVRRGRTLAAALDLRCRPQREEPTFSGELEDALRRQQEKFEGMAHAMRQGTGAPVI